LIPCRGIDSSFFVELQAWLMFSRSLRYSECRRFFVSGFSWFLTGFSWFRTSFSWFFAGFFLVSHRFFVVSLCLLANAEMVPKIPSCHYLLLM